VRVEGLFWSEVHAAIEVAEPKRLILSSNSSRPRGARGHLRAADFVPQEAATSVHVSVKDKDTSVDPVCDCDLHRVY
jgi:hypothetical protein